MHDRFPTFGLELSQDVVRVAECSRTRTGVQLRTLAERPLPASSFRDGNIVDDRVVARTMTEAIHAANPKTRYAAMSLPERHTFMKIIDVPKTKAAFTEERILWEATQHFPFSPDEAYYDWERIAQGEQKDADQYLVAAVPKEIVERTVKLFAKTKIVPAVLEPETLSLWRACWHMKQHSRPFLGLFIGAQRTMILFSGDTSIRFTAVDAFSGSSLTQTVAQKLHLSSSGAQKALSLFGLDPQKGKGATRRILEPILMDFAHRILDLLSYYREHFPSSAPIARVILAGQSADMYGLASYLQNALNMPTAYYDPQPALRIMKRVEVKTQTSPLPFATVIGLALRDIL